MHHLTKLKFRTPQNIIRDLFQILVSNNQDVAILVFKKFESCLKLFKVFNKPLNEPTYK